MQIVSGQSGDVRAASRGLRLASRVEEPDMLDDVVARLRSIDRQSGLERTLAIGEVILNQFFGGDASIWRLRRRNKNNSIRRLAARKDCPFGKSALNDAVAVYVAVREMPSVRTFGHIGPSHITAVLGLDEPAREAVLRQADHDRLSVRRLRERVVEARRQVGERRGRPAATPEQRLVARLRGSVRVLEVAVGDLASLPPAGTDGRGELQALVARATAAVAELHALAFAGGALARPRPCPPPALAVLPRSPSPAAVVRR
jgi:hypothetical protein